MYFIRKPVGNSDPLLAELLRFALASRLSAEVVCVRAGVAKGLFSQIAAGKATLMLRTVTALGGALGYQLKWERIKK